MRRAVLLLGAAALVAAWFTRSLSVAAGALALWLALLARLAPAVLRRVLRPRLWLVSLLLAMGSGLLLGPTDATWLGVPVSPAGLQAGVWMVVRGVGLLTLAALGAAALTRRGATDALARVGLRGAARAVRAAVETLPAAQARVVAAWRARPRGGRSPRRLAAALDAWFTSVVDAAAALAADAPELPPAGPPAEPPGCPNAGPPAPGRGR